jgi:hypothetical protein
MPRLLKFGLPLLTLLLAACGSGDEAILVEACEKDGGTREYCECRADILTAELDDEELGLLVDLTRLQYDEDLTVAEARKKLFEERSPTQLMTFQFAVMGPLLKADQKCR